MLKFIIVPVFLFMSIFLIDINLYKKTLYFKISQVNYFYFRFHVGFYGEYLTFRVLNKIKKGKVLTNLVIPNGEKFTEIDLLLIHTTGIYVVESKNYSGNIYGNERNRNWIKAYNDGKEYRFYNPIWQNNLHIRCLKNLLRDRYNSNYFNVIAFSKRCEIKDVIHSKDVYVVNRYQLKRTIKKIIKRTKNVLNQEEMNDLFTYLSRYKEKSNNQIQNSYSFKYQGILKK